MSSLNAIIEDELYINSNRILTILKKIVINLRSKSEVLQPVSSFVVAH